MRGYKTEYTEDEKERIVKDFLPFIKYTASRFAWRLPPQMTVDDLISAGLIGLLDALEKFEHGRVKLTTYAEHRIKGAMLDELRAVDWVPRSMKQRINAVKQAHQQLEKELGRMPEDEEVAESLEISLDDYYRTLQDASGAVAFRFEDFEENGTSGNGLNLLDCIPDRNAVDPLQRLEKEALKNLLAQMIDELTDKEKLLLSLYYWDELTMKEIGKVMNLTEGRVCQIHSQALIRLKSRLAAERTM